MNLLPISAAVHKLFPEASARSLARAALDGKTVNRELLLKIDLNDGTLTLIMKGEVITLNVTKTDTYTGIGKAYIHMEELK